MQGLHLKNRGNGLLRNRKTDVESPYKTAGIYAGVYSRPSLIHTQMNSSLRFGLCKRYLQQQKRFPGFSELPAGANAKEKKWNRREREDVRGYFTCKLLTHQCATSGVGITTVGPSAPVLTEQYL